MTTAGECADTFSKEAVDCGEKAANTQIDEKYRENIQFSSLWTLLARDTTTTHSDSESNENVERTYLHESNIKFELRQHNSSDLNKTR